MFNHQLTSLYLRKHTCCSGKTIGAVTVSGICRILLTQWFVLRDTAKDCSLNYGNSLKEITAEYFTCKL